jgi:hypothetical protein
MGQN